jgi:hypothetical protein
LDAKAQFSDLIVRPIAAADFLDHPIVLVLDGLDEFPDFQAIISAIAAEKDNLPSFLKILITSRMEESIQTRMDAMGAVVSRLVLDNDRNLEDIVILIGLYTLVFQRALLTHVHIAAACGVIVTIVAAQTPMTLHALNTLFGLRAASSQVTIQKHVQRLAEALVTIKELVQRLRPVLFATDEGLILVHHRSFIDVLLEPNRCVPRGYELPRDFLVTTTQQHHFLAVFCLREMDTSLTVNKCRLDPSLLLSEVDKLQNCISENIPETLVYACRFWARHVSQAALDDDLLSLVRAFYSKNFLLWLEVLSISGYIYDGARHVLMMVGHWVKVCTT